MNNYRYDSRYHSQHKRGMQEAIEYILDRNYGDTISNEILAKILKFNIENETEKRKYGAVMGRIKNFLIEKGYILKSITGVGFYILKPKQISGYCYHTYVKRTQVLLEKSDRILTHVDISELSDIRKEEHSNMLKLNQSVSSGIFNNINNSEYEKNKDTYNSLDD